MKYFLLSVTVISCFGMCHAADDASYTTSPYNDDRDHAETFMLISSNYKKLCTRSDGQPIDPAEQKRSEKLHDRLKNNTNCSLLIKPLENRFFRIVLRNQQKLVGVVDLFENAIDHDSIKKHDGYCETLLTDEEHTTQYPLLIAAALKQCKDIGVKRFVHHLVNNAMHDLPEYKSIIAAGFAEQKQTEFEKQYNVVRFEKTLEA